MYKNNRKKYNSILRLRPVCATQTVEDYACLAWGEWGTAGGVGKRSWGIHPDRQVWGFPCTPVSPDTVHNVCTICAQIAHICAHPAALCGTGGAGGVEKSKKNRK